MKCSNYEELFILIYACFSYTFVASSETLIKLQEQFKKKGTQIDIMLSIML